MAKKRTDLDGLAIYYNGKTPEQWYSLYCQQLKIEDAATAVLRAASRGDQQFIDCLRGDGTEKQKLRHAIADLHDALRKDGDLPPFARSVKARILAARMDLEAQTDSEEYLRGVLAAYRAVLADLGA